MECPHPPCGLWVVGWGGGELPPPPCGLWGCGGWGGGTCMHACAPPGSEVDLGPPACIQECMHAPIQPPRPISTHHIPIACKLREVPFIGHAQLPHTPEGRSGPDEHKRQPPGGPFLRCAGQTSYHQLLQSYASFANFLGFVQLLAPTFTSSQRKTSLSAIASGRAVREPVPS